MAKILAFDTSTEACSAALLLEGEIHEQFEIAPRRHTALLLPMVDDLLKTHSLKLTDLDAIAFGQGPGSFMGVRIATSVAQGLAYGANLPVIPVSSLQALAQAAYTQTFSTNVLVGWDARMDEVYWGAYTLRKNIMQTVVLDRLDPPSEINPPFDSSFLAAGNAWEVYGLDFPNVLSDVYPTAAAIAVLAAERYERGELQSPVAAQPLYLRNQVAGSTKQMRNRDLVANLRNP